LKIKFVEKNIAVVLHGYIMFSTENLTIKKEKRYSSKPTHYMILQFVIHYTG